MGFSEGFSRGIVAADTVARTINQNKQYHQSFDENKRRWDIANQRVQEEHDYQKDLRAKQAMVQDFENMRQDAMSRPEFLTDGKFDNAKFLAHPAG